MLPKAALPVVGKETVGTITLKQREYDECLNIQAIVNQVEEHHYQMMKHVAEFGNILAFLNKQM